MSAGTVHVVGAGMAGLATAVRLAEAGIMVHLHEAAPQAGGRARSYLDATLGCRIDNGNHLLIAGNRSAMRYLDTIGARDMLTGPGEAAYHFFDCADGVRWVLRLNRGRLPWWILSPNRRVPGTKLRDYLAALKLRRAATDDSVTDVLPADTTIFRRLWQPLAIAALNTPLDQASAALLGIVLGESFGQGGAACVPLMPKEGLSETLVDPALAYLRDRGAEIRFGARLRGIAFSGARVASLDFDSGAVTLAPGDAVVLAVTAPVASRLLPEIAAPDAYHAILNAHFRVDAPPASPLFIGIVGGTAEWVFKKPGLLSVTVSAADRLMDTPTDELAAALWRDVAAAYRLPAAPMPPVQIVKERRATFAASRAQLARRPSAAPRCPNLTLAGDWTATGLPATIEGAIRSGFTAAEVCRAGLARNSLSAADDHATLAPLTRTAQSKA